MPKILVIEDDKSFRNVLVQMLEKAGFEVRQAGDGNQALQVCGEFNPDVVLTDIIMPDKEGLETIGELISLCPQIKIIAMSGGGKTGAMDFLSLAVSYGASCTLTKPLTSEGLLKAVEETLRG